MILKYDLVFSTTIINMNYINEQYLNIYMLIDYFNVFRISFK